LGVLAKLAETFLIGLIEVFLEVLATRFSIPS